MVADHQVLNTQAPETVFRGGVMQVNAVYPGLCKVNPWRKQ